MDSWPAYGPHGRWNASPTTYSDVVSATDRRSSGPSSEDHRATARRPSSSPASASRSSRVGRRPSKRLPARVSSPHRAPIARCAPAPCARSAIRPKLVCRQSRAWARRPFATDAQSSTSSSDRCDGCCASSTNSPRWRCRVRTAYGGYLRSIGAATRAEGGGPVGEHPRLRGEGMLGGTDRILEEEGKLRDRTVPPVRVGRRDQAGQVEYQWRGQAGVDAAPDEVHGHAYPEKALERHVVPSCLVVSEVRHVVDVQRRLHVLAEQRPQHAGLRVELASGGRRILQRGAVPATE